VGRILGLDLGERRIGMAVSDPLGITAQGLPTLVRAGGAADLEAIASRTQEYEVERIVLGLPLRLDGTAGPAAEAARRFAADLERYSGLPVDLWDERLTTVQAERTLTGAGVRRDRRKASRDRLAAVLILQSWLDAQASGAR
jgi:putative Holliday junction resolvase